MKKREMQTVRELPELTNSDLEFLFTQLLEGVEQARGEHWAQRWLQNIEHRVSQQRWLDWLEQFGKKLLASSAPNYELASRMVELGELEIGQIGDVAYDIGVQLLARNSKQQPMYSIPISTEFEGLTPASTVSEELINQSVVRNGDEEDGNPQPNELIIESIATNGEYDRSTSVVDSPGQELLREFGDLLWEDYEPQPQEAPVNNNIFPPNEELPGVLYEQVFEYNEELVDEIALTSENTNTPAPEDHLSQGVEELQHENEDEEYLNEVATPASPDSTPGQDLVRNLGELLWDDITPQVSNKNSSNADEQEFIHDLGDLVWDNPEQDYDDTILAPSQDSVEDSQPVNSNDEPIQDSPEDFVEDEELLKNFNALLELTEEDEPETEPLEQPTASVEPSVATAIDELLGRLDESANLVQQLASGLGERQGLPEVVVENEDVTQKAEAFFYQGLAQARAGNLESAVELYEKALEIKPDVHEYWFNRGLTLFHLGFLEEAIASYDKAIEIKNDFYKGWYNRGRALGELGLLEDAITSFNTAIEIRPNYQEAWSSNGLALLKLGRVDEAIFSYDKSLELEPLDPENWYYRGLALSGIARYEDAIDSYDKALEIEPYLHDAWIDRGVALGQLTQWMEAIDSWDEALKITPDFYLTWFNRAVAFDNLGHREEAVASYDKALELQPNFPEAWYNRAVALFYLEQYEQAIL